MKRLWLLLLLLALNLATPIVRAQSTPIPASASLTTQGTAGGCTVTSTACLYVALGPATGATGIELSGTWTGTVSFYGAISASSGVTKALASTDATPISSATANGAWQFNTAAYTRVLVVFTTATSGTVKVSVSNSNASARATGGGGGGGGGIAPPAGDIGGSAGTPTVVGLQSLLLPTLGGNTGCLFDNAGTLQLVSGCNSGISSVASYLSIAGGVLTIGGQTTQTAAFNSLAPNASAGQGDLMVSSAGASWIDFVHNTVGLALFCENGSGVPSWCPSTTFAPGSLGSGDIFVGSAGSAPTDVPMSGDCSLVASGAITCLKTNGVQFAASATTDATNATNVSTGTLNNARLSTVDAPHGGSGVASPAAHSLLMGEGTSPFNLLNAGLTGQSVQSNNGADFTVVSPGLAGRSVSGTTDTILCDSATTLRDRLNTVAYTSASATAITLPQAGSSGCSSNFTFAAINLNAAGVDTFTPTTSTINGGATLAMGQNVWCAISSPDNANYAARCATWIKFGANITPTYNADGSITIAGSAGGGTPCTATALSFQFNNAGAFGCAADFTLVSSHTLTMGASGLVNLGAGGAGAFVAPFGAGFTAGASGVFNYDTTAGNSHFRIAGADAIGAGFAAHSTAGFLPKATDSTHGLLTASLCDEGATTANVLTCTDSAGAQFSGQVAVGTGPACVVGTAGGLCLTEGTAFTNSAGTAGFYPDATAHEFFAKTAGASAAGMFVRAQPGSIHSTGNVASIGTATLCAASAGACNVAGQYGVHFDFTETGTACAAVTAGSVTFNLTWTDTNGTAHSAVSLGVFDEKTAGYTTAFHFNTALGTAGASGDFTISTNGTVIQYSTTYAACTTGTGTYQLDAAVTRFQ